MTCTIFLFYFFNLFFILVHSRCINSHDSDSGVCVDRLITRQWKNKNRVRVITEIWICGFYFIFKTWWFFLVTITQRWWCFSGLLFNFKFNNSLIIKLFCICMFIRMANAGFCFSIKKMTLLVLGLFNSVQNTFIRPPVIKRQLYKYFTDLSKTFLKQALPQNKPCVIY